MKIRNGASCVKVIIPPATTPDSEGGYILPLEVRIAQLSTPEAIERRRLAYEAVSRKRSVRC